MYSHFSHMSGFFLLLNTPHPNKIAWTNGVNKSEFVEKALMNTGLGMYSLRNAENLENIHETLTFTFATDEKSSR